MNLRKICSMFFIVLLVFLISGCSHQKNQKIRLVVWGPSHPFKSKGWEAAIAEFERRHPNVDVKLLAMMGYNGEMNPQKIMTAVVGRVPPDVIYPGRNTMGDWASRGAFIPLDDLIARDRHEKDGVRREEYYKAAWDEIVYKGKTYAVPDDIDTRALYYNRELFRKAGLDPDRPPRTWDELEEYTKKLTLYNSRGEFKQLGFIPHSQNYGNSWFCLYCWQNGGELMSMDGRKCVMNSPRSVDALEWLVKFFDKFNIDKLNSFASGFKSEALDPFSTGKLAMKIECGWFVGDIARYNPGLDFAVAPPPVPRDRYENKPPFVGQPRFITWSGGYSWAIPRGAKNKEISWKFIKWMVSEDAARIVQKASKRYQQSMGRPYVPWMVSNAKVNEMIFREYGPKQPKFKNGMRVFIESLSNSRYRPVTPVGQLLWDQHEKAFENAVNHKASPQAALDKASGIVQTQLDRFLGRSEHKKLDWKYPLLVVALCFVVLVLFCIKKYRNSGPMGRLARSEALAGLMFASPWVVGFLVFMAGPLLASLIFSFCDYDVLHAARWVGLGNYKDLITVDRYYIGKSVYNAAYLAIFGIPLNMAISLGIAMLLNTKVSGMRWYRTIYYLPSILPVVANAILWIWILNPQFGLINVAWRATLTNWLGIAPPLWLASEHTAKPALIVMSLWSAGGGMILWLAGLQGVPRHLYEAAELDGASWWGRFRNVTLPMLTPYIFFNLIMGTIGVLQSFDAQYIMTQGGPVDSTLVPVLYLFNNAFQYFKMGYASAIAWLLFLLVLGLTLVQLKLAPRWVYYEGEEKK
ncbi:MAG: extracellular solute-binding protein [Armatimonadota bacterium]|nr:extracellular solute-binding protein [bacterium]